MNEEQKKTSDLDSPVATLETASPTASEDNEDSLYRAEAVAEYAEAQQSYHLTQVITPRTWIITAVLSLCLTAIVLWFFFGTVVTRIAGEGLFIVHNVQLHSVHFEGEKGTIVSMDVVPGQKITKGQILSTIIMPVLMDKIRPAQQLTHKIKKQYRDLKQRAQQSIQHRTQKWASQKKILIDVLEHDQIQSEQIGALLVTEEHAGEGIISRRELISTKLQYSQLLQNVLMDKKALSDLNIEFNAYKDNWRSQLRALRLQLIQQEETLRGLENTLLTGSTIRSPINGTVFWRLSNIGDSVSHGQSLLYVIPDGQLIVQGFIPANQGKMIQVGMAAEVTPSFTQPLQYGAIKGKVIQMNPGIESAESMTAALKSPLLVKQFLHQGPVISVLIQLDTNANNPTGFDWTASSGPDMHFTAGTLVNVSVLVKEQHPVSFILPRLEKLAHV